MIFMTPPFLIILLNLLKDLFFLSCNNNKLSNTQTASNLEGQNLFKECTKYDSKLHLNIRIMF